MVQMLLEKGANINALDKKDRRAIHWAAYVGHVEVVRLLISFGAEIGCRDKQVSVREVSLVDVIRSCVMLKNAGFKSCLFFFYLMWSHSYLLPNAALEIYFVIFLFLIICSTIFNSNK